MSTFIKISGGQSALLQANQAQAAANRQAALERMSREKAGQQGKRERDARRKQEGLDKDGRVIFGVQPRPQPTSAPGVFLNSESPYIYDIAGVRIESIISPKPGDEQTRTITLSTVEQSHTQTYDLYRFPLEPGYNTGTTVYNSGRTAYSHDNAIASTLPQYSATPITGAGFNPANSAGLPSVKTVTVNQRLNETAEDYVIAYLPLSKTSMVLTVAGRYGGITTTRNEILTETVHQQSTPTLSPNPLNETINAYFRNHSTTLTNVSSTAGNSVNGEYAKSWLVTDLTITEIPTPSQLQAKLLSFVPSYTFSTSVRQQSYTLRNRTYTDAGMYYDFDQPFETPPNSLPQPVRIREENRVYGVTYWPFTLAFGLYVFCDYSETVETLSYYYPEKTLTSAGRSLYDYALYGLWGFASPYACISPGVYALLENQSAAYDYSLNEDIAYLYATYMTGYPLPKASIQAKYTQDQDGNNILRFDVRKPMSNTAAPEDSLKNNKSKHSSFLDYSGYYYAWDWGLPSFCRNKLLALGFTEADLTP